MKKIFFIFFILTSSFFYSSLFAENSQHIPLKFYVLESEFNPGKYVQSDISLFKYYDFGSLPHEKPNHDRMITLKSQIFFSNQDQEKDFNLVLLPSEYAYHVYLNGFKIHMVGNYKNGYTNRIHHSETLTIPGALIKYNAVNEITMQLYPKEGEKTPFQKLFISERKEAESYVFWRNFWSIRFLQAMALCSLFIFVYYLILFLLRKDKEQFQYLYFAIMNLSFVTCYINNFFTYDFVNTFALEKISRLSIIFLSLSAIFFLLEYTDILKKHIKKIHFIVLTIFIPAFIYLAIQPNTTALNQAYQFFPIKLVFFGLFIYIGIMIAAMRKKPGEIKFILLFIFFIFHLGFVSMDIYQFAVVKTKPYLMMVPYSLFLINLILFYLLAKEQAKIYQESISKSLELKKLNENLENIVAERTQDLTLSNDTLNKFFSIIAHDLKGPIGAFSNTLDFFLEQSELNKKDLNEYLSYLRTSANQTYSLLENLLTWSLAQKREIIFKPVKIKLHHEVQNAIKPLEIMAKEKKIKIEMNIPTQLCILADINTFDLVIRNITSNAIKFSYPESKIELTATQKQDWIEIVIRDYGIGISSDHLLSLFTVGSKVRTQGTKGEKGSGLGLILCKEFIEGNHGKIKVESEKGKGTSFIIHFPKGETT